MCMMIVSDQPKSGTPSVMPSVAWLTKGQNWSSLRSVQLSEPEQAILQTYK